VKILSTTQFVFSYLLVSHDTCLLVEFALIVNIHNYHAFYGENVLVSEVIKRNGGQYFLRILQKIN
jgi:hypothetical protein